MLSTSRQATSGPLQVEHSRQTAKKKTKWQTALKAGFDPVIDC
jgi:hypothetical protein